MAKTKYIDNEKMYKLFCDLRKYSDYDPEVYMLRKKNFKGLKFINGVPDLTTIVDDEEFKEKKQKDGTVLLIKNKNAKTAAEKRITALEILQKDKEYKAKYEKQLLNETEEDTILRRRKVKLIKQQIGRKFLLICNNIMKLPSFTNYTKERQGDMISDATWVMIRYMNRYDLEKTNPFAYFTTVCRNAFIHQISEKSKYSDRFKSLPWMENLDGSEINIENEDENEYI